MGHRLPQAARADKPDDRMSTLKPAVVTFTSSFRRIGHDSEMDMTHRSR
jgi:hypothetical protein